MFGLKKPTFLGIDFGTSSIKAVELRVEEDKVYLNNYAEINLTTIERGGDDGQGNYDARVTTYLRALLERLQPKTKQVYVAMPAFIGLVALAEFPRMSEKELQEAIQFEAHKYIPSPLEEVALSWEIVGEVGGSSPDGKSAGKVEVLLVAALNKEVERYESYIGSVGYDMQLLELETFSMVRAVVDGDAGVFLVADIGSRATNLVLVENGLVKVSRNLDVGGRDITRTLTEGLGISEDRAESLKKSSKDYLNAPGNKLIFPALEAILSEMQRIIGMHQTRHPDRPIDGIILSGGTAGLTGLSTYYSNLLNLPVTIGDPWERILYTSEVAAAVERMGTSFSVALGLALQGANRLTKKQRVIPKIAAPVTGSSWDRLRAKLTQPIGKSED